MKIQLPSIEKLSQGYKFDQDREVVSLIFINYFIIFIFSVIVILLHVKDEVHVLITYRYHALVLISLFELWLIRNRFFTLARILILSITPFLLLILPPLGGVFDNEFYFWFPYVPIALSLIPHFILHTSRNRVALIAVLALYFLLALLIDNYLLFLSDGSETIIPVVQENRFYYNLIPLIIFVFVNLAIGLVFAKNHTYEEIVRQHKDELIQSEKMASLGTLTARLAHEINNPLNFISGSLHAMSTLRKEYVRLEQEVSPEKQIVLDHIAKIMDNSFEGVRRASDIITSLEFFANPGKEEKKYHDFDSLLYKVIHAIERRIPYHISLTRKVSPGIQVHCYEELFQQVLSNVIENAIEAIEETGIKENRTIHVKASETKREHIPVTHISISNNGPAIPEKNIKNIFDPFFTLKDEDKRKGLGLAISYMIIKEHKGTIRVRNQKEKVVFDIILPKD